ncbi:isochorismate synthase MenF [Halovivax sp.]|uniref:isochorismate synthase n=1 Tax=Halovivax sp. TaxID=1935978 RepID=UPI0025C5172F|nr:isochorismate synthase [Halovivax sp.]
MERASGGRGLASGTNLPADSLASRSCRIGDVSFGAALDAADRPRVSWAAPDGLELVGWGAAARLTAEGPDRFRTIAERADETFGALSYRGDDRARPRAFGGFSFHDRIDGGRTDGTRTWDGFAAGDFVIPNVQLSRHDDGSWLTVVGDERSVDGRLEEWRSRLEDFPSMRGAGTPPGIVSYARTTEHAAWTRQVERTLERISAGDLRKVVLAQAMTAELGAEIDVPATLERLRRRYPDCYRFAVDGGPSTFFGAPPERLVAAAGRHLETEALAGSVPRGETPETDDEHADRLRESEKLDREHALVVDAIRSQLDPLSETVRVDARTVRRLATIQHLQTPIRAELDEDRHVLEIVDALHPTPAVGGVPQRAACETIRSVEPFDRGWYAAPVGWFDANGDGEFAVGIRSGVATDRRVTLFAGNGIVADSDPDEEWREVELKFRPILDELR